MFLYWPHTHTAHTRSPHLHTLTASHYLLSQWHPRSSQRQATQLHRTFGAHTHTLSLHHDFHTWWNCYLPSGTRDYRKDKQHNCIGHLEFGLYNYRASDWCTPLLARGVKCCSLSHGKYIWFVPSMMIPYKEQSITFLLIGVRVHKYVHTCTLTSICTQTIGCEFFCVYFFMLTSCGIPSDSYIYQ